MQATVKWFNTEKGYGFLDNGAGPDIYVNRKSMTENLTLAAGDIVELECCQFEGKLVARKVRRAAAFDQTASDVLTAESVVGDEFEFDDNIGNREQSYQLNRPRFVMR